MVQPTFARHRLRRAINWLALARIWLLGAGLACTMLARADEDKLNWAGIEGKTFNGVFRGEGPFPGWHPGSITFVRFSGNSFDGVYRFVAPRGHCSVDNLNAKGEGPGVGISGRVDGRFVYFEIPVSQEIGGGGCTPAKFSMKVTKSDQGAPYEFWGEGSYPYRNVLIIRLRDISWGHDLEQTDGRARAAWIDEWRRLWTAEDRSRAGMVR